MSSWRAWRALREINLESLDEIRAVRYDERRGRLKGKSISRKAAKLAKKTYLISPLCEN
jgi:hypothetical protein